jgi:hypothetical protein
MKGMMWWCVRIVTKTKTGACARPVSKTRTLAQEDQMPKFKTTMYLGLTVECEAENADEAIESLTEFYRKGDVLVSGYYVDDIQVPVRVKGKKRDK